MDSHLFLNRRTAINSILDNDLCHLEFVDTFLGDLIGSGSNRQVFVNKQNPKTVVKIQCDFSDQSNFVEGNVWDRIQLVEWLNQWFCPVRYLSPGGRILIMDRARPVPINKLPSKVPNFFTDLKYSNVGWYKNRVVFIDYGAHLLLEKGMSSRMRNVNNWF